MRFRKECWFESGQGHHSRSKLGTTPPGWRSPSDEWEDSFYEAGCDDALVGLQRGLFVLDFNREADTLAEAVESACADIHRAGATIVRIEPDPLVSPSDIAERAAITRQAVSLYVNGERGEGFPTPVACVSGSRPLWKWSEVAVWLRAAGKIDQSVVEAAQLFERLNVDGYFVGQHSC